MSDNVTTNQQPTIDPERQPADEAEATADILREQLMHRENLAFLGQLTAGILHEIKNPLNFMNNLAKLSAGLLAELGEITGKVAGQADKDTLDDLQDIMDSLHKNINGINENGQRAERIIKHMLSQARENNAVTFVQTDINQMVDEFTKLAYQGMRGQDSQFNLSFNFDFDPMLKMAWVDAQSLSRVIINIVNNSCYALNEKKRRSDGNFKPELSVTTKKLDDAFTITIKDNGLGMAPEVVQRAFHPFFTTKPSADGTGLGLYMSQTIITQTHHGKIEVDSKEDEYTVFTITIPLNLGENH